MAGAGYKLFGSGDTLTAAQVNTYLNEQSVMVFASAAARDAALTSVLSEGMVCYLTDTGAKTLYDGSAWVTIYLPWTSYTPTLTNVTIGNGTETSSYSISGGVVHVNNRIDFGSTTAFTGWPYISTPVSILDHHHGYVQMVDISGATNHLGHAVNISATNMAAVYTNATSAYEFVSATNPFTWATGDAYVARYSAGIA